MKKPDRNDLLALAAIFVLVIVSLIMPREMEGENDKYWFFSRLLTETGSFAVPGRSPLYTIYLNLFRWMGYPASVITEYIITALITLGSLYLFYRKFVEAASSFIITISWMPYLLFFCTPQVHLLSIASVFLAIFIRYGSNSRYARSWFYALLMIAWMFRTHFFLLIILAAIWDITNGLRNHGLRNFIKVLRPQISDWPVFILFCFIIIFSVFQSTHPWNNLIAYPTTWSPTQLRSMGDSILEEVNIVYIGSSDKDAYLTNRELFNGSDNIVDALSVNPGFIISHVLANVSRLMIHASSFSTLHYLLSFILPFVLWDILRSDKKKTILLYSLLFIAPTAVVGIIMGFGVKYYLSALSVFAILYGALMQTRKTPMLMLFNIGFFILIGVTVVHQPKANYTYPFMPVIIFSALWYGSQLKDFLIRNIEKSRKILLYGSLLYFLVIFMYFGFKSFSLPSLNILFVIIVCGVVFFASSTIGLMLPGKSAEQELMYISRLIIPVVIILFSNGPVIGSQIMLETKDELLKGEINIHTDAGEFSMMKSYEQIRSLVKPCQGVMTRETRFFWPFIDIELSKLHNILELPPYGHFDSTINHGLTPELIDCVFVSTVVSENDAFKNRYENYIKPYEESLLKKGAVIHNIPYYGYAVIYNHTDKKKENKY